MQAYNSNACSIRMPLLHFIWLMQFEPPKNRPLECGYSSWPSCQYLPHILRNAKRRLWFSSFGFGFCCFSHSVCIYTYLFTFIFPHSPRLETRSMAIRFPLFHHLFMLIPLNIIAMCIFYGKRELQRHLQQ